jgi:hypothetical protein
MSPRRKWDSALNPSLASVCALPPPPRRTKGGGHTRLRLRGWGSPNSDDWRKSLALCLLCDLLLLTKLQCTLQLRAPVHLLYFISTLYVLCGWHAQTREAI